MGIKNTGKTQLKNIKAEVYFGVKLNSEISPRKEILFWDNNKKEIDLNIGEKRELLLHKDLLCLKDSKVIYRKLIIHSKNSIPIEKEIVLSKRGDGKIKFKNIPKNLLQFLLKKMGLF